MSDLGEKFKENRLRAEKIRNHREKLGENDPCLIPLTEIKEKQYKLPSECGMKIVAVNPKNDSDYALGHEPYNSTAQNTQSTHPKPRGGLKIVTGHHPKHLLEC